MSYHIPSAHTQVQIPRTPCRKSRLEYSYFPVNIDDPHDLIIAMITQSAENLQCHWKFIGRARGCVFVSGHNNYYNVMTLILNERHQHTE